MEQTNIGRTIRLFLIDGNPAGLMTAEIMNWTGHVLTGPRSKLKEIIARSECQRTGVYFLIGPDSEGNLNRCVYIGESDDIAGRLIQHNRPEENNGKDFWERVCLISSKDHNLTKGHIKYLESLLIHIAKEAGNCILMNGTEPAYGNLPEADQADMKYFIEQIRTILPVLGFDFLRDRSKPVAEQSNSSDQHFNTSPEFLLQVTKNGVSARAKEIDGEFLVLKGSVARAEWSHYAHNYSHLYKELKKEGVLMLNDNKQLIFSKDQVFSSPSAAAAVVCGRAANGRTSWKTKEGETYADWQQSQLDK